MPSTPLRILLLEDVPMDAELIEYELRRANIDFESRCVCTRAGFEAALHEFEPDLVLSDYTLPQFDGMEALAACHARYPTLPFIIVTGSINEETAVRCMRAGATDYLLKSNLARIGPAIEAALERESARAERLRAETALHRSEANLRAIFDSTLQAFVLADRDGRIQVLNATAARLSEALTGLPLAEGSQVTDFPLAASGDIAVALAGRQLVREQEIVHLDGGERCYECTYAPVVDDQRGVLGVCISATDVTERRRVEESLRRAERMEATGKLAGGVAHEVNNMMTAVIGFADFLLRGLDQGDPRTAEVNEILKAAHRAADVTQQLLAFSRQQFLQPRVLDANAVVNGMVPLLRRSLGEDRQLRLRLGASVGRVRADPSQIEQVILNLVLNARDAMPRGGSVTIETGVAELGEEYANRHRDLQLVRGRYVLLAVSDTGHGMDSHTLSRIFEPFFTTKPVGKGTGLGLSTAYGIVKQSSGYIWAYSEPGEGTVFKVYLPQVVAPSEADAAVPALQPARGTETILVVEDEQVVRDLTCRVLREYGYTVLEARNGTEALTLLTDDGHDVRMVVSDVVMPGMGGRELGARVGLLRPELPILFMSGYTGDDVIERGLLAPGSPLEAKPFTPDRLAWKVRDILDGGVVRES
ncbi:MAG TPA: response regulator [Gemmatimonadales bacterium]